ncbi:calmin [Amia ocellicauda]|uniref:calmin n=1 Tax=Amia ocellicauda TaxID=2972642 RepID=UPI0034644061
MAGHEWDDWFEREELIGQISDIRVQNLQVEREVVQKRTFTRWINLHLEKCKPPLEVNNLFKDIQDGRILMALLEELSGYKLLHGFKPSSHRIFRLNNIAKVLNFLEERNVKLVSIDAADIADGNSSIVLGLIWNIILFFQIKELTGNIKSRFPSSSSLSSLHNSTDSDTSHPSTPCEEKRVFVSHKDHGRAIKTLLHWVQRRTRKYGVAVQDFGKSWTSGLAFLAVIKAIDPGLVDMKKALEKPPRENLEDAFRIAHYSLGIPRLLEPEDVTINSPDEQSIMTYVSQFLEHFPELEDEEISEVVEKSLSEVRQNSLLNEESDHNAHKNGDRPYVVRNDWIQPPPKIFISSVSDDLEQVSPVNEMLSDGHGQPWNSEEDSSESTSSYVESPGCRNLPLELGKEVSFTVSSSSSPQPSFVDSVIDSPDSWSEVLGEAVHPESLGELHKSRSDSSLNESELSLDHTGQGTTGVEWMKTIENVQDSGTESALEGNATEDTVFSELFIDEGAFSQTSMDGFHTKSKLPSEEEDAYRYILDLKDDENAEQDGSEQNKMSLPQNACGETDHPSTDVSRASVCNSAPPTEVGEEGYREAKKRDGHTFPDEELCNSEPCEMNGSVADSAIPQDIVYYSHYVTISDVDESMSEPPNDLPCDEKSDLKENTEEYLGNHVDTLQVDASTDENHLNKDNQGADRDSSQSEQERLSGDFNNSEKQTDQILSSEADALLQNNEDFRLYKTAEEQIPDTMPGATESDFSEQHEDFRDLGDVNSDNCECISPTEESSARKHGEIPRNSIPCESARESHLPHVLYLRKLNDTDDLKNKSSETKEGGNERNQTISCVTRSGYRGPESSVTSFEDSSQATAEEIHLLFFLWILLYCLFLLPQLDLQTLPQFFFN